MNKKFFATCLATAIVVGNVSPVLAADATSGASASQSTTTSKPSTNTSKPSTSTTTSKPSTSKPNTSTTTSKPSTSTSTAVNKPGTVYIVQDGDVLWKIAQKFGLTYQEVAEYNNLKNPNLIYTGQKLVMPEVKSEVKPEVTPEVKPEVKPEVDATTSASFPTGHAEVDKALGIEGTWIVCITGDLTIDKEIIVDGKFYNKNDESKGLYRKLALYDQDENKNVTAEHTLTAPKMTVKSENFKIQEGTFVGDIYVEAPGFTLTNTEVKGNIYFAKESYRKSFKLEKDAKVSGVIMTGEDIDATSGASLAKDEDSLQNALDNKWIVLTQNDITTDKEIVMKGRFEKQDKNDLTKLNNTRKLALYDQDENKNVTAEYTLTTPKLTVKSINGKIQEGTVVGDIYVEAPGFSLVNTNVDGNIYFTKEAFKRTADLSKIGTVTGTIEVKTAEVDAVTSASFPTEETAITNALSEEGTWIICLTDDLKVEKEISVDGKFHSKNNPEAAIYRKLALYAQDSGKNVTEEYVLTVPKMTVKSENFTVVQGEIVGDIYVEANGFTLTNAKVNGNIYFAKDEYKETFVNNGTVTGEIAVK